MRLLSPSARLIFFIGFLGLSGCATVGPVTGALYADVQGPVAVTSHPRGSVKGEACATSYLGLVALGNASITAAASSAKITHISYVEQHSTNILGIITKYCTEVYGLARAGGASKPAPAAPAAPAASTPVEPVL